MATIVNDRDVQLQAASPRVVNVTLPPNVYVPNAQVNGLGNLALLDSVSVGDVSGLGALASKNKVDVMSDLLAPLTASNISGLGALAVLNSINLATQATGNISNSQVSGLGSLALMSSLNLGSSYAVGELAADRVGAGALAAGVVYSGRLYTAQYVHAYGSNPTSVSSPAWGTQYPTVYGQSTATNGAGGVFSASGATSSAITAFSTASSGGIAGVFHGGSYAVGIKSTAYGAISANLESGSASYPGVLAGNASGGEALRVAGSMTITSSNLVSNLNANYLQGKTSSDFATSGHTHSQYVQIAGGATNGSYLYFINTSAPSNQSTRAGWLKIANNGGTVVWIPFYV